MNSTAKALQGKRPIYKSRIVSIFGANCSAGKL